MERHYLAYIDEYQAGYIKKRSSYKDYPPAVEAVFSSKTVRGAKYLATNRLYGAAYWADPLTPCVIHLEEITKDGLKPVASRIVGYMWDDK